MLLKTCQSCLMITLKNKQTREAEWVDPVIGVMVSFKKASTECRRICNIKKHIFLLSKYSFKCTATCMCVLQLQSNIDISFNFDTFYIFEG